MRLLRYYFDRHSDAHVLTMAVKLSDLDAKSRQIVREMPDVYTVCNCGRVLPLGGIGFDCTGLIGESPKTDWRVAKSETGKPWKTREIKKF